MKKGDKFCGYTSLTHDYVELEVLRECRSREDSWEVRMSRPNYGWEKYGQATSAQIQRIVNNLVPANLDNV